MIQSEFPQEYASNYTKSLQAISITKEQIFKSSIQIFCITEKTRPSYITQNFEEKLFLLQLFAVTLNVELNIISHDNMLMTSEEEQIEKNVYNKLIHNFTEVFLNQTHNMRSCKAFELKLSNKIKNRIWPFEYNCEYIKRPHVNVNTHIHMAIWPMIVAVSIANY